MVGIEDLKLTATALLETVAVGEDAMEDNKIDFKDLYLITKLGGAVTKLIAHAKKAPAQIVDIDDQEKIEFDAHVEAERERLNLEDYGNIAEDILQAIGAIGNVVEGVRGLKKDPT